MELKQNSLIPITNADLKKEIGGEGKFIACYIGTMGMAHGLETLLEAAAELKNTAPQVFFLLVGDGAEKENIASRVRLLGLANIRLIDSQPREKIPAYICASDVCLVPLKRTKEFETVIPTKMLEFMACARPVILGVEGQAKKLSRKRKRVLHTPENAEELAQAVMKLAAEDNLRKTLGNNGRRYVLKHFSRPQTAIFYLNILEKIWKSEKIS